ncbi:metallopeptidase M24 [Spraguea lophii 42_110]|uniref:Metallopeptidase M24 n=1 Tax=Spraguea lophii (strain 42_110) TaxID=1358809 RepID=S7XPR1_SPRLO|nr:metallopeptidase M24 [Spraguea lophii 42_110]
MNLLPLMNLYKHGLDGYIVFNSDEHLSEFVGDADKRVEFLSGFTGSNGTITYLKENKFFYTDSRYTLMAKKQLKIGFKVRENIVNDINQLEKGKIGLNKKLISYQRYKSLRNSIKEEIEFVDVELIDSLWKDKLKKISKELFTCVEESIFYKKLIQKPTVKKYLDEIDRLVKQDDIDPLEAVKGYLKGDEAYLLTELGDIAWLLNLRGADIQYVPEFYSYAYVKKDKIYVFLGDLNGKVDKNPYTFETVNKDWILEKYKDHNIEILDYNNFYEFLDKIKEEKIYASENINQYIYEKLEQKIHISSFVAETKSIKSRRQLKNVFIANIFDGVALVNLFGYLEYQRPDITEIEVAEKLKDLKKRNELFLMESFRSIVGSGDNGAIIHHDSSDKKIDYENTLLLIDAGSQYSIGTTDISRTLGFGKPTVDQIKNYTLVLKGQLEASMVMAPQRYFSSAVDIAARKYLWESQKDYGHGTGHGVGYVLDVHEMPPNVSIRGEVKPHQLYSIEPGFYAEGKYGIRLENLAFSYSKNNFLRSFILTPVPIQITLVDKSLLTGNLYECLDKYNKMVKELLLDYLDEDGRNWLMNNARMINIH